MVLATALPCALVAVAALTATAGAAARAQTAMSVSSVLVSVADADGLPTIGLAPDDFVIEANGTVVDALEVAPARHPLLLMVDTGAAAREVVTSFREPLQQFARRTALSPLALMTFGDTPIFAVKFTADTRRLSRGIDGLFARPETASYLLDGLHRVAEEVRRLEVPVADAVVVTALSFDASRRDPARMIRELVDSGVRVHVVAQRPQVLATMSAPAARSPRSVTAADMMLYTSREQAVTLNELSAATGGSFQQVDLRSGLAGALQFVQDRHLGDYVVSFVSPPQGPGTEGLRLRVNLPGARVTLRELSGPSARRRRE